LRILAIHLPAMTRIMRVPVSAELARRNPSCSEKLDEYHLVVKTFTKEEENIPIDHREGVYFYPSRSRSRPLAFKTMYSMARRIIKERNIEAVTTQDQFFLGLIGVMLKKEFGIPLNVQCHFSFLADLAWKEFERFDVKVRGPLGRYVLKQADSFYVGTETEKKAMVDFGLDENSVWYTPYTVDTEELAAGDPEPVLKKYNHEGDRTLLLFLGRLIKQKDCPTLIKALSRVAESRDDVHLIVLGEGPDRPLLDSLTRELGLTDRVHFAGYVENHEVPSYYAASDLVVIPSIYEGTCRVIIEAAAHKKTVVTTSTAGARDAIQDGVNGFVVKRAGDPEALAKRILEALDNRDRLPEMGERLSGILGEDYSIDRFYCKFIDMLEYTVTAGKIR